MWALREIVLAAASNGITLAGRQRKIRPDWLFGVSIRRVCLRQRPWLIKPRPPSGHVSIQSLFERPRGLRRIGPCR